VLEWVILVLIGYLILLHLSEKAYRKSVEMWTKIWESLKSLRKE
jgi:hypothetical protein